MAPDGSDDEPSELARFKHESANALGAALGRLQLLQRRARRGWVDIGSLVEELGAVEGLLHRAAALLHDLGDHPSTSTGGAAPTRARLVELHRGVTGRRSGGDDVHTDTNDPAG